MGISTNQYVRKKKLTEKQKRKREETMKKLQEMNDKRKKPD